MYEAKLEIPARWKSPTKKQSYEGGGGGGKGMDIFRITYVFLLHSLPVKYESIKKLLCLCCHLNSCRIKGHLFAGP